MEIRTWTSSPEAEIGMIPGASGRRS
jgi:hypothetical protein